MKRFVISLVVVLVVVGGAALAAVPGPDGVIHACMLKGVGTIRIIHPSQGQKCSTSLETTSGRDGNGEVHVMNADGSSQMWLP